MTPAHETPAHGTALQDTLQVADAINDACPWSGKPVAADALTVYGGAVVDFWNPGCRDKFAAAVGSFEGALRARRDAAPGLSR